MTDSAWAIRLYKPEKPDESIEFISNLRSYAAKFRPADSLVLFRGMYGIEDYVEWYVHKDLSQFNLSNVCMDVKLFLEGDPDKFFFHDNFRIHDVKYSPQYSKYIVFGVQEDYEKLLMPLYDFEVRSISYKTPATPVEVLTSIFKTHHIFNTFYHEPGEALGFNYEYKNIAINYKWRLIDLIDYICNENEWEWALKHGVLHFGPELNPVEGMRTYRIGDPLVDNISDSTFFKKLTFRTTPMDVLSHWREEYRCVWAKHWVGAIGGYSKGCFVPRGSGKIDKVLYLKSLEGAIELNQGLLSFYYDKTYSNVILAKIISDTENEIISQLSLHKKIEKEGIKIPRNVVFETEDSPNIMKEIGKTTPYLDDGAGIMFPVSEKPPNFLIFTPNGRIESAVAGPFVFGDGRKEFVILKKNPKDFRFSLPNGWTLYVDEHGNTLLQTDGVPSDQIPTQDQAKTFLKLNKDGTVIISTNNKNVIINEGNQAVSLITHTHDINTHTHTITPGALLPGPGLVTQPGSTPKTQGESDKHSKNLRCET